MKVYLSSTFVDLREHRAELMTLLRKAGHEVVCMEEYAARDMLVPAACKRDVQSCDIYVGVFAWRYGHIPKRDNPQQFSVTHMEYVAADEPPRPVPRLTFLLREEVKWLKRKVDSNPTRIAMLREVLKERLSGYFGTPEQLANEVLAALSVYERTAHAQRVEAIDVLAKAEDLGPSYLGNIKEKLPLLTEAQFIDFRLGPTPWWHSRLHLVSALIQDFGKAQGLAFSDEDSKFVLMARPSEVRKRLARQWPQLEDVYTRLRASARTLGDVAELLYNYPQIAFEVVGKIEREAACILNVDDISYELGIAHNAEVVSADNKPKTSLQAEIVGRATPFVALTRSDMLDGIVDRHALMKRLAELALIRH